MTMYCLSKKARLKSALENNYESFFQNRRSVSGSDFVHVVSKTVDMKHWGKLIYYYRR